MTDRELMKLALEALDWAAGCIEPLKPINCDCPVCWASNALRERLAKPQQPQWHMAGFSTPPRREWVGLTDEEKLHLEIMGGKSDVMLAEAIEAKLKEKNA